MEKKTTFLLHNNPPSSIQELKKGLENTDNNVKIQTMHTVLAMGQSDSVQSLLMPVIQHVLPRQECKPLVRLALLFFELAEKKKDGKLLTEMILVVNFLREMLLSANEFVRGCTLRFLSRVQEWELLDPLVPSIKANLAHQHSFVRRNAVISIWNVWNVWHARSVSAPGEGVVDWDVLEGMYDKEADVSVRRDILLVLGNVDLDRALKIMLAGLSGSMEETIAVVSLDIIRKASKSKPEMRGTLIKALIVLLDSKSASVQYEGASTLLTLSRSNSAIRQAAGTYSSLLASQSDNNVKLIVLDRLRELCVKHSALLSELAMDVLQALSSPSIDIRQKCLDLAMALVTARNVEEVMQALKKEVLRSQGETDVKAGPYRQGLISSIHRCCLKFPDVAHTVVNVLLDLVGDPNSAAAVDVVVFVREITEAFPSLRPAIVKRLLNVFPVMQNSRVLRTAMWIIGEYTTEEEAELLYAMSTIRHAVGSTPLLPPGDDLGGLLLSGDEKRDDLAASTGAAAASAAAAPKKPSGPKLTADGSYASQSAADSHQADAAAAQAALAAASLASTPLRALLVGGDYFLGVSLSACLTKLALKLQSCGGSPALANTRSAEAILVMCHILRLGQRGRPGVAIEADSKDRISVFIRVLADTTSVFRDLVASGGRESLAAMLAEEKAKLLAEERSSSSSSSSSGQLLPGGSEDSQVPAGAGISFRQLRPKRAGAGAGDHDEDDAQDLVAALGSDGPSNDFASRLARVTQLTGFSDPVYAEACVTVNAYDIMMEVTMTNQTAETLQSITLELATVGEIKVCERPAAFALAPGASKKVVVNLKVSSTETGVVFGNIVVDGSGANARRCIINLSEVSLATSNFINPAQCSDSVFRAHWLEFEWENKVAVNTRITDVKEYLKHVMKVTNMGLLNSDAVLGSTTGDFLSANLYARSLFNEDALCNLSVEKEVDGKLSGFLRIRSKTQGIALSLGDTLSLKQKGPDA